MVNKKDNSIRIDGRKLAEARKKVFLSQRNLADAVGMHQRRIAGIEQSPVPASVFLNKIPLLAHALKMNPDEVVRVLSPDAGQESRPLAHEDSIKSIPIDGRKLAEARKRLFMRQKDLAQAIGFHRSRVSAIEQSEEPTPIFLNRLPRLAQVLRLSVEEAIRLLSPEKEPDPSDAATKAASTQATAASQFGLTEAEAEAILKRHLDEVSRAKEDRLGSGREHRRVS